MVGFEVALTLIVGFYSPRLRAIEGEELRKSDKVSEGFCCEEYKTWCTY